MGEEGNEVENKILKYGNKVRDFYRLAKLRARDDIPIPGYRAARLHLLFSTFSFFLLLLLSLNLAPPQTASVVPIVVRSVRAREVRKLARLDSASEFKDGNSISLANNYGKLEFLRI